MKKVLSTSKDCADVKDEIFAFFKFINLDMINSLVKYTKMSLQSNRTMEDSKEISKNSATDISRSEIMAVIGILFLLGYKKCL